MNTAVLLFVYKRSSHTKQVLDALKHSIELPERLLIFQDGVKHRSDYSEWKKVNDLICSIDWCDKEIVVSDYNKGLADSIVSGINYAFERFEAVIILEDDCVPTANFTCFMNQCFKKYKDDKQIYSVSGYNWPLSLRKKTYDVYGCGRISSWGWGTWKDRWAVYKKDYELVRKMKQSADASKNLAAWGQDLEETLVGNIRGSCDSWAVFWALNVISRQGICINPYESFIRNIGMDGSGVHCGITNRFDVECIDEGRKEFHLPDKIALLNETKQAFASLHGSYTAANEDADTKERIVIYGAGNFYLENEKRINEDCFIECFIDQNKKGYFAGKKIICLDEINDYEFEKIIVMVRDETVCANIVSVIKSYGIPEEKIEIGLFKFKN